MGFKKEILKEQYQAISMLKEKPAQKTTGVAEQKALAQTQGKKKSLSALEKGAGSSGLQGCHELMQE